MTTQRVFFRKAGPTLGLNVYRSYDGELLGYVERAEVESLRDLLLREFPVAAGPRDCTCTGVCKGAAGLAPGWRCAMANRAPEPPEPNANDVRRSLDEGWFANQCIRDAARAWLRSREEQADHNADIDAQAYKKGYVVGWAAAWAAATSNRRERRARIATTLFAGMLANRDTHATAVLAVSYADSLIAALDNNKE